MRFLRQCRPVTQRRCCNMLRCCCQQRKVQGTPFVFCSERPCKQAGRCRWHDCGPDRGSGVALTSTGALEALPSSPAAVSGISAESGAAPRPHLLSSQSCSSLLTRSFFPLWIPEILNLCCLLEISVRLSEPDRTWIDQMFLYWIPVNRSLATRISLDVHLDWRYFCFVSFFPCCRI